MSDLVGILRAEQRRHFAMSFGLVTAAIVAGTMVTNERGVFSTIGGGPLSALERAFSALVDDAGRTPPLFRRNAPSGLGSRPSDVIRTPANLGRRPGDVLGDTPNQGTLAQNQLPDILSQPITPDQIAANNGPGTQPFTNDFSGNPTDSNPGPTLINPIDNPTGGDTPTQPVIDNPPLVQGVPEPAVWALMIGGLGLVGWRQRHSAATRRRRAFLRGE